MATDRSDDEELSAERCWELLGGAELGRLALRTDDGVDVFPVNFLVTDGVIYFRSAPGSKLMELTREPAVAFEADGIADRKRWSVVVKGVARRLDSDPEIEASGVLSLHSLSSTEKWNYVAIRATSISGRRFSSARRHGAGGAPSDGEAR